MAHDLKKKVGVLAKDLRVQPRAVHGRSSPDMSSWGAVWISAAHSCWASTENITISPAP